MTTSPLFGEFSEEARCSSRCVLAFRTCLMSFYCPISWHLSLGEGGLRMSLDLL